MEFKVGDKITCINGYGCDELTGKHGKIVNSESGQPKSILYTIEFPFVFDEGHSGISGVGRDGHCRNMYKEHIKKQNIFVGKSKG